MIYGLGWTNWLRLARVAGDRAAVLLRLREIAQPAGERTVEANCVANARLVSTAQGDRWLPGCAARAWRSLLLA